MSQDQPKASRRGFFFGATAAGVAAAAVTAMPKLQPSEPVAIAPRPAPDKGGGYSLTEHVKQYYKTTLV